MSPSIGDSEVLRSGRLHVFSLKMSAPRVLFLSGNIWPLSGGSGFSLSAFGISGVGRVVLEHRPTDVDAAVTDKVVRRGHDPRVAGGQAHHLGNEPLRRFPGRSGAAPRKQRHTVRLSSPLG